MAFGLGLGIGFCRRFGTSAPPVPTAPAWDLSAGDGLVVINAFPVPVGDWDIVPGAGGANIISFPEF